MSRLFVLLTTLLALAAGAVAAASPAAAAVPRAIPGLTWESCQQIRTAFPFAPDGVYPLVAGDTLLTVFCYDMRGTPREYLDLARTGGGANFSQYTAGGASPGTDVRTSFTKLRIDPATLTVDIGDLTFATSTGRLQHSALTRGPGSPFVTAMPYATATSCTSAPDGAANIDLRGTPFTVEDPFQIGGFAARGAADVGNGGQTVALAGGGYCGWISAEPVISDGFTAPPGTFRLDLGCAPREAQPTQPARYCIPLS